MIAHTCIYFSVYVFVSHASAKVCLPKSPSKASFDTFDLPSVCKCLDFMCSCFLWSAGNGGREAIWLYNYVACVYFEMLIKLVI